MSHRSPSDSIAKAFPHAPAESWQRLAEVAIDRSFAAGDSIARHGQEAWLVLVLEGHAALRRRTDDARELVVRVVGAEDLVGTSVIASRPVIVDIVALSNCHVLLWPGWEIQALAAANSGFARDLFDHGLTVG